MSPEAQRIAIAEACGWKLVDDKTTGRRPGVSDLFYKRFGNERVPDFLNDLNAMHEAEKVLTGPTDDEESQRYKYSANLVFVCGDHQEPVDVWYWEHITATAAQRAEAFLRTIGKWQELEGK